MKRCGIMKSRGMKRCSMKRRLLQALLAPLLAILVTPALAQKGTGKEREPPWYRVEIIIFRYLDTSAETEQWPDLPDLSYPRLLRHLRSGSGDSDLGQEFILQRIEDTTPTPAFDLAWDKSAAELLRLYRSSLDATAGESVPSTLLGVTETTAAADLDAAPLIDPASLTVPRAFVSMPADAEEFTAQALRIRRSRDMRLMLHQSWLQPMRSRDRSLPIAIASVDHEGSYPVVQGSLTLYVSRYLHIETRLWLNTHSDDAAAAQTGFAPRPEADWHMPAPPLPPPAYQWTPRAFKVELDAGFSDTIELPPDSGELAPLALTPQELTPLITEPDPADVLQPIVINARRLGVFDIEQFLAQPWYPFDFAVQVQHKRRMRGGELHYLDHPLLGIILRVSPYQFEAFYPPQDSPPQ